MGYTGNAKEVIWLQGGPSYLISGPVLTPFVDFYIVQHEGSQHDGVGQWFANASVTARPHVPLNFPSPLVDIDRRFRGAYGSIIRVMALREIMMLTSKRTPSRFLWNTADRRCLGGARLLVSVRFPSLPFHQLASQQCVHLYGQGSWQISFDYCTALLSALYLYDQAGRYKTHCSQRCINSTSCLFMKKSSIIIHIAEF
jgi:hypothetical protein